MSDPLDDRSRALEAAFFPSHASDYREALRLREQELAAVGALREASGIAEEPILRRLAALGIRAETLAALTMIPIVEVAWADGEMDERERDAILVGAESVGIEPGSPSHGLLRIWTEDEPAPDLLVAWREFIGALHAELEDGERERLRQKLVARARTVAEAAGGILGVDPVSPEEAKVLERLDRALRA
jgi:hypothetical protein